MEAEPIYRENKPLSSEPLEVRSGFITKVYGIMTIQLVLTAALACPFVMVVELREWVKITGQPLILCACTLNILFALVLACPWGCHKSMRTFPINYVLLAGFTLTEGLLVGVICAGYTLTSVLFAVFATGIQVFSLTMFAMTTKSDFTGNSVYIFAALMCMMIFSIFCFLLPFPVVHKIACCMSILVFSFHLILDTQQLMREGKLAFSIDDYVSAAIHLYIFNIQLFLYILQLFGHRE